MARLRTNQHACIKYWTVQFSNWQLLYHGVVRSKPINIVHNLHRYIEQFAGSLQALCFYAVQISSHGISQQPSLFRLDLIRIFKSKAFRLEDCSSPGGSRKLSFPDFMKTAALRAGRLYSHEIHLVLVSDRG